MGGNEREVEEGLIGGINRECGKCIFKGNAGIWETADRSSNLIGFGQILDKYLNNKIGKRLFDFDFLYELYDASILYWIFS